MSWSIVTVIEGKLTVRRDLFFFSLSWIGIERALVGMKTAVTAVTALRCALVDQENLGRVRTMRDGHVGR